MSETQPRRAGTTAGAVFARLVEALLRGEFTHGTALREAQLARQWNVSRTPMREAVRRAAEAGFVVLRPNQAPLVRPLTVADIRDLYDFRELLEVRALKLAWPRLNVEPLQEAMTAARPHESSRWPQSCRKFDVALHATWTKHNGNSWLTADLEWLYQFVRSIQSWVGRDHAALADGYAQHVAIVTAIRRRDKAAARSRLREHIEQSAAAVVAALARQRGKTNS